MEKFMKYQWIVYLLGWFVFQLFPAYFGLTSNFGVANGKLAGWQMFLFAMIANVVVALATFILLLGQSWHN